MRKILEHTLIRLDVRALFRDGSLTPGRYVTKQWSRQGQVFAVVQFIAGKGRLTICNKEWQACYSVRLTWTACPLGGHRVWFRCPKCQRRCALIYSDDGIQFACRECLDLGYQSQLDDKAWRELRRRNKIRDILGWHGHNEGERPKGMRQATFQRLCEQHDDHDRASLVAMARKLRLDNAY